MSRSKIPVNDWMKLIFHFSISKNGISATEIAELIGVSYPTAFKMGHKIRGLLKQENAQKFYGEVEADESWFGGKKKKNGTGTGMENKTMVFGITQRGRKTFAIIERKKDKKTLIPYFQSLVRKGSRISTDHYPVYDELKGLGFKHKSGRRRKPKRGRHVHSNSQEGFWGNIKVAQRGTHHNVTGPYLQNYLDEAVFRYKKSHKEMLPELIERLFSRVDAA